MMLFGRRKLLTEIGRLSCRVAELEERLCPCENHQWKKIDMDFVGGTGRGDEETVYTYKCKRCGKSLRTWKPFLEKEADGNG